MLMFPSLTIALLLHGPSPQADSSQALYVIENIAKDEGTVTTRNLVRVSMDRENRLVKKTLLSKDQRFFSHFGGHRIVLERFIVTRYGGVIDIQTCKVINDEDDGEVLGLEDDKVVYRINNSLTSGLFSFDLKERNVAKVKTGEHWDLPGEKSPDKTMSIKTENTNGGVIWLHRIGQAPKELGKGFRFTYSQIASRNGNGATPLWLDGERILVVQANRKLVILTTQGAVENSVEIKDAPAGVLVPPRLWRDEKGRIIYSCGRKNFLINIPKRGASPLKSYWLGHGFEAAVVVDKEQRRCVYFKGKVIGQWVFNPFEAETAPGLIAFPYVQPSEAAKLAYPDRVAIWSKRVGDLQTLKMSVNDLIGWSN